MPKQRPFKCRNWKLLCLKRSPFGQPKWPPGHQEVTESKPVCLQMSPVMKSPSETSRATVAPPATGFGGPALGTAWFSATHSAFSENPRDPGDSQQPWKCPHHPENLAEQALLLKLSEGVALPACRKPFRVTIHPPGDPPPTEQGIYFQSCSWECKIPFRFQPLRRQLDTHTCVVAGGEGWPARGRLASASCVLEETGNITNFKDKPEVRLFL